MGVDHLFPPMGPGGGYGNQYIPPQPPAGPAPQQSPWQAQGYPPLPRSPSNHPTPPISSGLPSPVRSHAPSPSPRHSHVPSPPWNQSSALGPSGTTQQSPNDWDDFHKEYFRQQAIWRQEVKERKAEEALRYCNAGGTEPLDYDTEGNLLPYLWYRLQQQQRVQPQQPNPVVLLQEGLSSSQPRCSGRTTWPVVCPDNLYRNQAPIDTKQMTDTEFQKLMGGVPATSR